MFIVLCVVNYWLLTLLKTKTILLFYDWCFFCLPAGIFTCWATVSV